MFSEPQTPGTCVEYSFSETKPPVFDIGSSIAFEASRIQATLNRRLGPEYVSQRPAPGGGPKLTYVEGWKIIGLANEVFGYNGWCSTVTKIETDFIDMDPESRRYNIGVTAIVKVTLKDGTHHEDVGYGTAENLRSKGAALDKAKKEAVTDGVKRALRNFGNLLGLCLYEKSFTQEVVKIKPQHVCTH
ncbi:Rad52/22 family double-strand break repair protein-domain-containing protein [Russula ochroleuca]|uniref:Rad52/22 family double-strand break repair protein-domain-containing protein n=1 Tax=Russula ochroleuca TaxID=152965 RepID=A0A9P5TBX2_9AGAM|nr:Rad52/22 family double-strand break repair protein-domain-containing protein [Russula ochroleuca]